MSRDNMKMPNRTVLLALVIYCVDLINLTPKPLKLVRVTWPVRRAILPFLFKGISNLIIWPMVMGETLLIKAPPLLTFSVTPS